MTVVFCNHPNVAQETSRTKYFVWEQGLALNTRSKRFIGYVEHDYQGALEQWVFGCLVRGIRALILGLSQCTRV